MGKRAGEPIADESDALKSGRRPQKQEGDEEEKEAVEFEDEYDDEYESEEEVIDAEGEEEDEGEQRGTGNYIIQSRLSHAPCPG